MRDYWCQNAVYIHDLHKAGTEPLRGQGKGLGVEMLGLWSLAYLIGVDFIPTLGRCIRAASSDSLQWHPTASKRPGLCMNVWLGACRVKIPWDLSKRALVTLMMPDHRLLFWCPAQPSAGPLMGMANETPQTLKSKGRSFHLIRRIWSVFYAKCKMRMNKKKTAVKDNTLCARKLNTSKQGSD